MFNIVLIGSPGAGKGTQSQILKNDYGFTHICLGDILRKEIKAKSTLGQRAKAYMDQGLLVPNELVIAVLKKSVQGVNHGMGFLFDGYPRSELQASMLDAFLRDHYNTSLSLALFLEVDEGEAKDRIKKRSVISHRTDDQDDTTIERRMLTYRRSTLSILEYYTKQGKLTHIQGVGSLVEVTKRIKKVIDAHIIF